MDVWKIFAYISDNTVKELGLFSLENFGEALRIAKIATEDENAFAVDVTHIPVKVDDTYSNDSFYRNGVKVNPIPTVTEQINEHSTAIDDLIIAITPTEAN